MNSAATPTWTLRRLSPSSFFLVSAVFHYLGPSFAVLLFAHVDPAGVAWLRISSAAAIFAAWRRPWRRARPFDRPEARLVVQLGIALAAMNICFYFAIARLPLATVGAIEFLGTVTLAAVGTRTPRNVLALGMTVLGVAAIAQVRIEAQPLAFAFAFANCALFVVYLVLGHRVANPSTTGPRAPLNGIDRLAASMLVASIAISPFGLRSALPALLNPPLLFSGVLVGVCSSVIPYVMDQLAMSRLPRATFALMLALLPVFATAIGAVVLKQVPTPQELFGIALVVAGVSFHQQEMS